MTTPRSLRSNAILVVFALLSLAGAACGGGGSSTTCSGTTPDACSGACTDLQTDEANCGTCGTTCTAAQTCTLGACADICSGATPDYCAGACKNLQTDPANCGACGNVCPEGEVCSEGGCALSCSGATPDECGGSCTDVQTDEANCGACGAACDAGQTCELGLCTDICSGATPDWCGGTLCTDLQTDAAHCGTCTNACSTGGVCTAGECTYTGESCGTAIPILVSPFNDSGTFYGKGMDLPPAGVTCTDAFPPSGPDIVYAVQLAAGQTVTATLTPDASTDADLLLSVACSADTCLDTALASSDVGEGGAVEGITFSATTAQTYYLIVDTYYQEYATETGHTYALTVTVGATP